MLKLLILGLASSVLAQSSDELTITSQYKKVRTSFNGVTFESVVGYLPLNGSNTLYMPVHPSEMSNKPMNYTFMSWFKLIERPKMAEPALLFCLNDQVTCYVDSDFRFFCEFSDYSQITTAATLITLNQWIHLTLSTNQWSEAYLRIETDLSVIDQVSASNISIRQTRPDWTVCLGQCIKNTAGLIGGVRELFVSNSFIEPKSASVQKNLVRNYSPPQRAYYRCQGDQKQMLQDQYSVKKATSTEPVAQRFDMLPVNVCPDTYNIENFYNLTQNNRLKPYKVRTVLNQIDYSYTMLLTLIVQPSTCFTTNINQALDGCNIVNFGEVFMIYFERPNYARIHFFAEKSYYETQSVAFFVPFNQILNIQLSMSQKSGFKLLIQDQLGQKWTDVSYQLDLKKQVPTQQLALFEGLEGAAKSFMLYSQQLPQTIQQNITQKPFVDFDFSSSWVFSQSVVNQGQEKGLIQFTETPTTIQIPFRMVSKFQTSPFDGITCKNDQLTLQLNNKGSQVSIVVGNNTSERKQSSVEFWFKFQNETNYNTSGTFFSLHESKKTSIYWHVQLLNGTLIVAPFGKTNIMSPTITIPEFQFKNQDVSGWWHLSCSYSFAESAFCNLFNTKIQVQYVTYLADTTYFIPNSTLIATFGKINATYHGLPRVLIKEFRYWDRKLESLYLKMNRYQQIDPTSVSGLLSYVRLIGSLENFLDDLVQLKQQKAQVKIKNSFEAISMLPDFIENNETVIVLMDQQGQILPQKQYHVICPLQTYYFDDYKACISEPINEAVLAVFPFQGRDGQLQWLFTVEHSSVLNEALVGQLKLEWKSSNYYLNEALARTPTTMNKLMPVNTFIQGNSYEISASFQNSIGNSVGQDKITFVPDRCHWFYVEGSDAFNGQRYINVAQGVGDISFLLVPRQLANCSAFDQFTHFDSINTKFLISNSDQYLTTQPKAIISHIIVDGILAGINVTIPAEEQLKLPSWTDIKILMTLNWKGDQSVDGFDQLDKSSIFQHAMFKINFSPAEIYNLVATLTNSSNQITRGQDLLLDASNTTVTNLPVSLLKKSLFYSWQCPKEFYLHCPGKNSNKLMMPWSIIEKLPINFGINYTFQFTATWIQSQKKQQSQTISVQIVWYNATRPVFTISYSPTPVLVTANRTTTFQISSANFDLKNEFKNYNFTWSIYPELQNQLPFFYQGSQISVQPGFWLPNKMYQVTLKLSLTQQPGISALNFLNFTTGSPPTGGQIELVPLSENGMFNVVLTGWSSQLGLSIFYNVYNTFDSEGQQRSNQLNTIPIQVNDYFKVKNITGNPLQVQIFDVSGETVTKILIPPVQNNTSNETVSPNSTDTQTNTTNPNPAPNNNTSNETTPAQNNTSNETVSPNSTDTQTNTTNPNPAPNNNTSNETTPAQNNTSNETVSPNSTDTQTNTTNPNPAANNNTSNETTPAQNNTSNENVSSNSTDTQTNTTNLDSTGDNTNGNLTNNSSNPQNSTVDSENSQNSAEQNTTSDTESTTVNNTQTNDTFSGAESLDGRNLQSTAPTYIQEFEIVNLFNNTDSLLAAFDSLVLRANGLETNLLPILEKAILLADVVSMDPTLNQVLQRLVALPANIVYQSELIVMQAIVKTGWDQIIQAHDAQLTLKSDLQSISFQQNQVLKLTSVKAPQSRIDSTRQEPQNYNIVSLTNSDLTQSTSMANNFINSALQIKFNFTRTTFYQNQTMCAVSSSTSGEWDTDSCLTEFDPDSSMIVCICNMLQSQFVSVREDDNRISSGQIDSKISRIKIQEVQNQMQSSSYILTALIAVMFFANTLGSLVAWRQDRRTTKAQTKVSIITQQEENFVRTVSHKLEVQETQVRDKLDKFKNFSVEDKSKLLILTCAIHPLLSPFLGEYKNRVTVFSCYMFQINLYALACFEVFGKSYRNSDESRQIKAIDQYDLHQVAIMTYLAGILLLPLIDGPLNWLIARQSHNQTMQRLLHSLAIVANLVTGAVVLAFGVTGVFQLPASNQYLAIMAQAGGLLFGTIFSNGFRILMNFNVSESSRLSIFANKRANQTLKEVHVARECAQQLHYSKLDAKNFSVNQDTIKPNNQSDSQAELVVPEN